MNMTKEEYVVGLDSKTSFCYRLRRSYRSLVIFMVQHLKNLDCIMVSVETKQRKHIDRSKSIARIRCCLRKIKEQIVFLIMNGEQKNYEAIRKCELGQLVRGKILAVFPGGLFVYFLGQAFGLFYKEAWDHK